MATWKKCLLLFLASAALLAVVTTLTELALRLFFPQPLGLSHQTWSSVPVMTPNFDFKRRETEFEIQTHFNSFGLRDQEYSRKKPAGAFRILALGDSITAALEVADREVYTEVLEASLNNPPSNIHYEVLNAGIPGFGTGDELRMWEYLGEMLEPDLVILQFSLVNDLSESLYCRFYKTQQGRVEPHGPGPPSFLQDLEENLGRWSHLAQFVRLRAHQVLGQRAARLKAIEVHKERYHSLLFKGTGSQADFAEDWQVVFAYLGELNQRVLRTGAGMVLVVRPLDPDAEGRRSDSYPRDILEAFCQKKGILWLDLTEPFRTRSGGNIHQFRFRVDSHWNPQGHRWAAEEILSFLEERGLVRAGAVSGTAGEGPIGVAPPLPSP
jgi:lysophospholipase L1-like esterase